MARRREPRRRQQQHPLKRLADQQTHGDLARLVLQVEAQIARAFADARASVRPLLAQFAAAYAAERKRLAEEQGEDADESTVHVPVHWLTTSGWGARVRKALVAAHTDASQASRRYVQHGIRSAADMGEQNARELLLVAMRPAIKAGMKWRPK